MKVTISVAEIGKIVSALQKTYPEDIDSFYLEKDLIYYAKDYFDSLPDDSNCMYLYESWLKEFDINPLRKPPQR